MSEIKKSGLFAVLCIDRRLRSCDLFGALRLALSAPFTSCSTLGGSIGLFAAPNLTLWAIVPGVGTEGYCLASQLPTELRAMRARNRADPYLNAFRRPSDTIPNAWKQWVAQSKLLKAKDEAIVEVLIGNGYSRGSAFAEVEKAKSDPYLLGAARTQPRLHKGVSLLNALGQSARLDSGIKTVERRSNLPP